MRVLLCAGVDLSLAGGLETHIQQLALGLAARGHAVEIAGRPDTLPPFHMVRVIEAARYDIVHHQGGDWPAGVDAESRYVRTLHFCVAAKMARYLELRRFRTLLNPGNWHGLVEERRAVRRGGAIIAVSNRVASEFERFHGLDLAPVTVIPNGARFTPPTESREALRQRHGIAPDVPVLLTIGRADFVKGFGLLERAWNGIDRGNAVWVTVGGEHPSHAPGRIVTGTVSHDAVGNWIHAADFGAMPSYYEGCSVALLEMLAGGLYVLGHDVGNAGELLGDRTRGRIVDDDEHAWQVALAETLAQRPRGAELDASYRWDHIVERTEQVYERAVTGAQESRT